MSNVILAVTYESIVSSPSDWMGWMGRCSDSASGTLFQTTCCGGTLFDLGKVRIRAPRNQGILGDNVVVRPVAGPAIRDFKVTDRRPINLLHYVWSAYKL
jgi:hypothetical protein